MLKRPQTPYKGKQPPFRRASKTQTKIKGDVVKDKIVFTKISEDQMGVCIPFKLLNDQYRQIVKSNSGTWDINYKIWRIPKINYTAIRTEIPIVNEEVIIEDSPQLVVRALQDQPDILTLIKLNKTITYDPIDKLRDITQNPLFQILYPFQRNTLQLSVAKYGRLLIADDMGVGKTLQSLACALEYRDEWPLLIICPSALKLIWFDQIGKWLGNLVKKDEVQIISKSGVGINISDVKIVIISYELASRSINIFNEFKVVIADEAHYLKNTHAQRTQNLVPFLTTRKRIFLLTGTPAFAKPREIYNLISIIRPDIYHSLREFGERYCRLQRNPWTGYLQYEGSRNTAELYYILKNKVMIRRLKSEVLHQLPEKQRQTILIDTDRSIVRQIRELLSRDSIHIDTLRNSQKLLESALQDGNKNGSSLPRCYQLTGMAKLNGIKQYIKQVMQNQVKALIFAHHKVVMDQLQHFLTEIKCSCVRVDGEMSHQLRQKRVKLFQQQSDISVALLSITCAGVGYTLTSASVVIFAELHWTPAMLLQAEDRAHRIGQRNCVNAHYLIGQNTLDPILYRALQRKLGTIGQVLNGTRQYLGAEDIEKGKIGKISYSTLSNKMMKQEKQKKIMEYFQQKEEKQKRKTQYLQQKAQKCKRITQYLEQKEQQDNIYQEIEVQQIDEEKRIDQLIRKRRAEFQKSKQAPKEEKEKPRSKCTDKYISKYA